MKNVTINTGMKMGATIGGLLFLAMGIVPGFYFGSFGTLMLLQKLSNGPLEPTLFVRAAIVTGIAVGIACAAAISVVMGSLAGAVIGSAVSAPASSVNKAAGAA
ncbi:MAG TPA: hypothetical protein VL197_13085 [Nitrospirota bacterium]|nr:hypothetical protein [Nitrospirota bacterium]